MSSAVRLASPQPTFSLPSFEGPLSLLLHLIRSNELDIYDIPIAEIARQYLEHAALIEELDLAEAGEYVVLAATLIEIKSRMLLPAPPPAPGEEEPEDPRAELVQRLLEYEQYQGAVETLRGWEELRRHLYFRGALENADDYVLPIPEGEAAPRQLVDALRRMLAEAGVGDRPVTVVTPRKRLTLRLKMAEVVRRLSSAGTEGLPFEALFSLPGPRGEIVLAFLALLELLRIGRARFEQAAICGPIRVYAGG